MARDPRYDILFEPVNIGPVTAPNRFFQTPHGNGHGFLDPNGSAAWRGMRAEGGWGVINTEQVEYHHSSDSRPLALGRLVCDEDIPALAKIADAVHEHGSLAGIELCYNSIAMPNYYSREIPLAPSSIPVLTQYSDPFQSRAMDKSDIKDLLRWQKTAALRGKQAGFDLIYVYAASLLGIPFMFLSRRYNHRSDEYGGSLKNRARLLKEFIEVTKDAVGDTCAVPVRTSVDELLGKEGWHKEEVLELFDYIGEMPDLWDLTLSDWSNDSVTSRFGQEGYEEPFVTGLKQHTSKPIVGVGRFTSPDSMVSQVRRGILDMVGAARASIADPFLPNKIRDGELGSIRECIGCNICIFYESKGAPARCTQNPTAGEEWRKGWHPEKIKPKKTDTSLLIVGAGPAGLECALTAANRGYKVMLAEATTTLGGRVTKEAKLPNLAVWGRVAEYREYELQQMPNVDIYLDNNLSADDIMMLEVPHIVLATGSTWRRDGIGRIHLTKGMAIADDAHIMTPDDIFSEQNPAGQNVIVYDDDYYYMANVIAEKLALDGYNVTLVCSSGELAPWTHDTLEFAKVQTRMAEVGVTVITSSTLSAVNRDSTNIQNLYSEAVTQMACDSVVLVTSREPNLNIYNALKTRESKWADAGIQSVTPIGDAFAPGIIAQAVYSGHRFAQEFEEENIGDAVPYKMPKIHPNEFI